MLLALVFLASGTVYARQAAADSTVLLPARFTLYALQASWLQTNNAAGMQLDSLISLGRTELSLSNLQGDFKLVQQPEKRRQLYFGSERFQPIGKALFYGSFSYTQQWDKNIRLSDVLDPYRGTPYLLADSIGGDWRKQLYSLKVKAATPQLFGNNLTLGLTASLNVGTGARQNDPRPLTTANEFGLAPSLTLRLNTKNHIGMSGWYGRYREELSLEVKNTSVNHYLYKFLGMGQYDLPGIFSVGASRTYNGNAYGGDAQYQYHNNGLKWLTTISYRTYKEQVSDGSTVPRKAGTWEQETYGLNSILKFQKGSLLHHISLAAQRSEDMGTEFHEYYNTVTKAWETILEAPFYLAETDHADLTYTLVKQHHARIYQWLAAISVNYRSVSKEYLLPASLQQFSRAGISLKAGKNWKLTKYSGLQASIKAQYSDCLDQSLVYVPITTGRTLLARELLLPDQAYLGSIQMNATVSLQYDFRLQKVRNARFFAGTNLDVLHNTQSRINYVNASGSRTFTCISLGAFY